MIENMVHSNTYNTYEKLKNETPFEMNERVGKYWKENNTYKFDKDANIVANFQLIAGLYDDNNNLVASWDELVNTYGMDVETDYTSSTYKTNTASPYYVLTNNEALDAGTNLVFGNVSKIGNYAFKDCDNLTNVTIPDGVTSIGKYMFSSCTSLTSITIPDNVRTIDESAFYDCDGLTSVAIPAGITAVPNNAFYDCTNLSEVTLPEGLKSIGSNAFYGCRKLINIVLNFIYVLLKYSACFIC